jgi:TPR repeat protein
MTGPKPPGRFGGIIPSIFYRLPMDPSRSMRRRTMCVILLCAGCASQPFLHAAFAQTSDDPTPPAAHESSEDPVPAAQPEEPPLQDRPDTVAVLNELRRAVLAAPTSATDRSSLAETLYRMGDLDAALEESRVAVKLHSQDARIQLQLGIILMAKQDWRTAATALTEAVQLDPALTQAHYSLGSVHYTLGNRKAAMQAYRRALELQPIFPDARYRLALILKLANQQEEAARLMEQAAFGGIPQAQYFMGNAYKNGQGMPKDLPLAIHWWAQAAAFGHQPAADALSQLRRQALSRQQSERRRGEALEAFRQYRDMLWADFPDLPRSAESQSLGIALLEDSEAAVKGVPTLLTEALALSEPAHERLASLYETGLDQRLAQYDPRILACLQATAADGFIPSKKSLARIYGKGLGLPPDLQKAKALLKGVPKPDAKALLDDIAAP